MNEAVEAQTFSNPFPFTMVIKVVENVDLVKPHVRSNEDVLCLILLQLKPFEDEIKIVLLVST